MTDTKQTIRQLPPWRAQTSRPRHGWQPRHPGAVLVAIKVIHTLAWFSIESCMIYLLAAGFAKRSDRRAALAAAVVGGESLIFAANGFRCPLTQLADSLGAERGSVTDIYLPGMFAHNLPAIHAPLLVLAACLHGRNLWQQRNRSPQCLAPPVSTSPSNAAPEFLEIEKSPVIALDCIRLAYQVGGDPGGEHSLCSVPCARFLHSHDITITSQMERVAHGRRANP